MKNSISASSSKGRGIKEERKIGGRILSEREQSRRAEGVARSLRYKERFSTVEHGEDELGQSWIDSIPVIFPRESVVL